MRNWTLVALTLATSLSASAALKNHDADRLEINVPNLRQGVIASISIGYMEPNSYNNGLVLSDISGSNGNNPNGRSEDIEPDLAASYDIMLGWKFCDTGWDVRAHLYHVDSSGSGNIREQTGQRLWTIVGNIDDPDFIQRTSLADGRNNYKVYAFDALLSQHINIGQSVGMRIYWGASYHTIEKDMQVGYIGTSGDAGKSQIAQLKSDFDGVGPNVGLEMDYYLCHNIGLVGKVGGSMLVGSINSRTRVRVQPSGKTAGIRHKDRCVVVPQVDFTLGLDYTHQLCGGSILRAELGYGMKHYFNGIGDIQMVGGFSDATHHHGANHHGLTESLTVHGVYLTLEGRA